VFFCAGREPSTALEPKPVFGEGQSRMKGLTVIIAAFVLVFGTIASRASNVDRISAATGVPVATLQTERASTGLGWGSLEKAHLLANATGQSFDNIVALHQGGQGWGKIAHDNGLKLGRLVSDAHRSNQASMHAQNTNEVHGKSTTVHGKRTAVHGKNATTIHGRSATTHGRGHTAKMSDRRGGFSSTRHVGHGSAFRSGFSGFRGGTHSMGHMSGSHGMGSMGHGGGHGR
jgi:hypothetical protein